MNLCEQRSHEEDPERHHAKCGHRGDKGHGDGEVDVPVEKQRPEVGTGASRTSAQHKETQSEQLEGKVSL